MALSSAMVWETRTTGNDNNGGGFKAAGGGTDYSIFDAAQFSGTDLVVDATTNTKVTSATHNFVAADVGNVIQITAGASWTTGFYEIVSVASNAATLDRSPAAVGTTGGTWQEGGAVATIGKTTPVVVAGNTVYVKASANYNEDVAVVTVSGTRDNPITYIGYTSTRTDGGLVTVDGQNSRNYCIHHDGKTGYIWRNFSFTGAVVSGLNITANHGKPGWKFDNVKFSKGSGPSSAVAIASSNFSVGSYWQFWKVEVTGYGATPIAATVQGGGFSTYYECYIHDNTGATTDGISGGSFVNAPGRFYNCIFYNNGRDGYAVGSDAYDIIFRNCIFLSNGGDGIDVSAGNMDTVQVTNSIFVSNGGYGIRGSVGLKYMLSDYNAYYNNTSGQTLNFPTGPHDKTLTGSPFQSAGSDFSLNSTGGAGADCKNNGTPGQFTPNNVGTGYEDIGALRHQDPAGGGGGSMIGGIRMVYPPAMPN